MASTENTRVGADFCMDDVNHAQKIGGSTISTDSKDSTGSDPPYVHFEPGVRTDQLSSSNDSSVKSTDSQCSNQCHEESRNNCLDASRHSGPYENSVLPKAEEETKASNRTIVHTNNQNEGRGHINPGFADSGPFQTIPGDSLNSTKEENESNNLEEKGHINHGFADSGSFEAIPGDSLDSLYTDTDITSRTFMMIPGIHVLKNKNHLPEFTTPIGKQQFQPHKTDCKISWRDSNTWPQIPCSLNVDETENVIGATNGINMLSNNEDRSYIADNRLFPDIDSSRRDSPCSTENVTGASNGINMLNNYENGSYIADSQYLDLENHRKSKKNCPLRIMILIILIGCISGVVAWIIHNKYFLGLKDTPTIITDDFKDFPDKCENDISTATIGEQMCIPYTQQFSSPSGIHVKQLSSQYLSVLHGFSVNVSSDTFVQQNGDWIINFNSSRNDQQFRFMKKKATCDSIGIYEITTEYGDGNVSSSKFEITLKDPQLQQSVTRINDSIHVHCEMIKTCMASSLALFVNDGGSARMIPDINVCSNNDKESGTTVSVDAIIPASWLSGNMTISCVPLMTDSKLAANLTSTTGIPVCEGDCVPDCKDDPQGEAYFPDKDDCTNFYQCSNGKLVSQTCSLSTYWSTSECTCVHFDDEICNRDTNRFVKPLLSIEKCTNASLV